MDFASWIAIGIAVATAVFAGQRAAIKKQAEGRDDRN